MNISEEELPAIPDRQFAGEGFVPPPQECNEPLVDITGLNGRIQYAGIYHKRNIFGALSRCLVRQGVWDRLRRVADELPEDSQLLIFDAFRPLSVQQALYEELRRTLRSRQPWISSRELEEQVEEYVDKAEKSFTHPAPHTTGGAVDLTLCRAGIPLDMGTNFEECSPAAQTDWFERSGLTQEETLWRDNRRRLYRVMTRAGFVNDRREWWHYAYGERIWARERGCVPIYGYCRISEEG